MTDPPLGTLLTIDEAQPVPPDPDEVITRLVNELRAQRAKVAALEREKAEARERTCAHCAHWKGLVDQTWADICQNRELRLMCEVTIFGDATVDKDMATPPTFGCTLWTVRPEPPQETGDEK